MHEGKIFKRFIDSRMISNAETGKDTPMPITVVAKKLGVTRDTVYSWMNAEEIKDKNWQKITDAFNITKREILDTFVLASELQNKKESGATASESNASPINFAYPEPNMYLVPLKAQGGFMIGYEKEVYLEHLEKIAFPLVRGECFGFEVDGMSMLPEFIPGDYVVSTPVESLQHLVKGKIYVFQTIDGILLKEFGGFDGEEAILISINDDYDPIIVPLKNIKKVYLKEFKITRN